MLHVAYVYTPPGTLAFAGHCIVRSHSPPRPYYASSMQP